MAEGERWLVYQRFDGTGDATHLGLVRPDGSGDHAFAIAGLPSDDVAHPSWSPDGVRIAFDVWTDDPSVADTKRVEAWTAAVDGTDARLLATCELPCLQLAYPTWSPDGSRVALIRYDVAADQKWGVTALEVLDVVSGRRHVVSQTADGLTTYQHPRWSPDGATLLVSIETFTDTRQTALDGLSLGKVSVAGLGRNPPTLLTAPDVLASEGDWDPSGDRIVFVRPPSLPPDPELSTLWTMAADGTGLNSLTTAAGLRGAAKPAWDPDGSRIWFRVTDPGAGKANIASVRPDGTGISVLTYVGVPRSDPHPRPLH